MRSPYLLILLASLVSLPLHADKACTLATGINVNTTQGLLALCDKGQVINTYKIALGRNGAGKKRAGDNKTPIGLYDLGTPRKSNRFWIFIPINYPTAQQRAAGFTGKDVGIHGPMQGWFWLNSLYTWYNWTKGCIAVENNQNISFIAHWIKKHPRAQISIE